MVTIDVDQRLCEICHPTICHLHGSTKRREKEKTRAEKTRKARAFISVVRDDSVFASPVVSAKIIKLEGRSPLAEISLLFL